ncbi:OmpW family protein [Tianweitania sp. BSSL-BM11]|uniref:OmpW family protein n=1 Tax=Tianweitania aestuarii TaxID=2814886 RepID=A0ABS5RYV6_9HYPH|nr:OmpW family protein [Tianweitania aestuarii]MBS9720852.1 OmpW family protein [Tianweitania aestuarii]
MIKTSAAALTSALLLLCAPAMAADLSAFDQPGALVEAPGPWQVRLRALGVLTEDEGSVDGIAGSDLHYSDSVTPELDITYYFTNNLAAELILGTTKANVHTGGSIDSLGKVGSTWVLPPTLTLQYHFTDFGAFKPYVGAGVNYTMFFNQKDSGPFTDMDIENTFGAALQVGFDYMVDDHWGFNVDVKKIFLEPDWTAKLGDTKLSGKAELNPWVIGAGVTYRF